jgi:hypothetical protein
MELAMRLGSWRVISERDETLAGPLLGSEGASPFAFDSALRVALGEHAHETKGAENGLRENGAMTWPESRLEAPVSGLG